MIKKLKLVVVSAALVIGGLSVSAFAKGGGKLDDPDRKAMFAKKKAAMLAKFDTNKDGTLDQAERTAMRDHRIELRFAKLDLNKDGVITLDEMKASKAGKHGGKGHKRGMRRGGLTR